MIGERRLQLRQLAAHVLKLLGLSACCVRLLFRTDEARQFRVALVERRLQPAQFRAQTIELFLWSFGGRSWPTAPFCARSDIQRGPRFALAREQISGLGLAGAGF